MNASPPGWTPVTDHGETGIVDMLEAYIKFYLRERSSLGL